MLGAPEYPVERWQRQQSWQPRWQQPRLAAARGTVLAAALTAAAGSSGGNSSSSSASSCAGSSRRRQQHRHNAGASSSHASAWYGRPRHPSCRYPSRWRGYVYQRCASTERRRVYLQLQPVACFWSNPFAVRDCACRTWLRRAHRRVAAVKACVWCLPSIARCAQCRLPSRCSHGCRRCPCWGPQGMRLDMGIGVRMQAAGGGPGVVMI